MTPINPSENFTPENNNIINKTTVVLGITNRTGSMITRIFHNDKLAEKAYYMLMARRIELGHNQKSLKKN